MTFAYVLVFVIGIIALIGTILAAVYLESDYSKKTKGNITRLSFIYAIVILVSLVAIGIYMYFK